MNHQTNAYSQFPTQNPYAANNIHAGLAGSKPIPASVSKQTALWESPTFEEFDLCMEVTAYFQPKQ